MRIIIVALAIAVLAGCQSEPSVQMGTDAEITHDGLHKVDNTRMQMVWVKPGLDLKGYNKIRLVGSGIEYRSVKAVGNANRIPGNRTDFPIDADKRQKLEDVTREVFLEELAKSEHFTIVTEEGPDVLEVNGALIDVVSNVPPEAIGRSDYSLSKLGEATLILEVRDSESNEIILRAADRRAVQPTFVTRSSQAFTLNEVKKELRTWARLLKDGLDGLHADLSK